MRPPISNSKIHVVSSCISCMHACIREKYMSCFTDHNFFLNDSYINDTNKFNKVILITMIYNLYELLL